MDLDQQFVSLLACPKTASGLEINDSQLVSKTDAVHYPIINGIPWLFKNPLHSMVDWSVKLNHFNQVLSDEIRVLQNDVKKAEATTKRRLELLLEGKKAFQITINHLVSPILKAKVSSKPVYDALSDRAPHTQNLLSYEANLYRDWVWGQQENQQTCELVLNKLSQKQVQRMLVLGAGSCRLAYDLHKNINPGITIANDINPLLLFAASEILTGKDLDIAEFPLHPRGIDNVVLHHQIKACEKSPDNFYLLFSDAAAPALAKHQFDLVVTPWLIDIQPFALSQFLKSVNHYLPIDGQWLNFGSLVFNQKRDSLCYSVEEIHTIAEEAGFVIEEISEHEIPYLKSPHNAGYRMENIYCWRAIKKQHLEQSSDLQNLPNWILDINQPIPKTKQIQSFAFSHQLYAELAAKIDGKKSIQQIGKKIARERSMDESEAIAMVKNFYLKIVQQTL